MTNLPKKELNSLIVGSGSVKVRKRYYNHSRNSIALKRLLHSNEISLLVSELI